MDVSVVIISLLMVGLGAFARRYPNTISGYSTMSGERRENVDIQAVGNLLYRGFACIACAMLVLYFLFRLLGMQVAAFIVFLAVMLLGMVVLMVMAQKYDKNIRGKFLKYLPVGLIVMFVVGLGAWISMDAQPTKATIESGAVKFSGTYGVEIPLDQVVKCELWDDIPRIRARTNGLGLGNILKGHFLLEDLGRCRLFIKHGDKPYLYLETTKGDKIIFNSSDPAATQDLFEALQRRE